MADYLPLLAKLVDGLTEAGSREAVYERARSALADQLRSVEPPLDEDAIARERSRLEDAIRTVERGTQDALPRAEAPRPAQSAAPRTKPSRPRAFSQLQSPSTEPVAIRRGGRRRAPAALLAVLTALAVPVAVVAWIWREPARESAPDGSELAAADASRPPAAPDNKYGERVVGGSAPSSGSAGPQTAPPATPPVTVPTPEASRPPPSPPPIAVAQRALLFEENQLDQQKPTLTPGSAIWRLDTLAAGQGMPIETVVRGSIDFPNAGLSLIVVIRRNSDSALPASHTIEMSFAIGTGGATRAVRDVALPQMRLEETVRGVALAGLPVPVKENIFLIGLSDLKGDIERNTDLLLRRNWMELPIRFASGQKAALLVDKGVSGDRVFQDAFRSWGQAP